MELTGMWFAADTDTDMKQAVTSSLQTFDIDLLYSEIQSLVQVWHICWHVNGD
jgi:hypothetical protein